MTRVGIVGCGYVLDHYMTTFPFHTDLEIVGVTDLKQERMDAVAKYYGLTTFSSLAKMVQDARPELILNLTSIGSHEEVIGDALNLGCHVYSEKPITLSLETTRALFDLAREKGLALSAAPCNMFSDSVQTMWKAIADGAIGAPKIAYAEFDDNPIYLMKPEGWRSRSGAPWPYIHEYESGCTIEHAGYHLTWLAALFGPAESVTAFSQVTVPEKLPTRTPDFSVGCIQFKSGVVARVTCSIAGPSDHRMRVIGSAGEISTDTYRHYQSPVYLEEFTQLSLNARKAHVVRRHPIVAGFFNVGGRRLDLVSNRRSGATKGSFAPPASLPRRMVNRLKRQQVGSQDKVMGVAVMAEALREGRPQPLSPDFHLHITELTLAIQAAGADSCTHRMTTSFDAVEPLPSTQAAAPIERRGRGSLLDGWIDRLHKH